MGSSSLGARVESPHDVLGLDADADQEEIEAAYRTRVKETHPDQGGSVQSFLMVRAAYEELLANGHEAGAEATDSTAPVDDSEPEPDPEPVVKTVEYLNYDVLADHGWSLGDDDLFQKAADAGLTAPDYGRFAVEPNETLLEAAEGRGFAWPFACRGGACANCAVSVCQGELSTPVNHILPEEMLERDIRLSCVGAPESDSMQVVYNLKHLPELDELRLPPRPFEAAHAGD
jgi:ferredoxin